MLKNNFNTTETCRSCIPHTKIVHYTTHISIGNVWHVDRLRFCSATCQQQFQSWIWRWCSFQCKTWRNYRIQQWKHVRRSHCWHVIAPSCIHWFVWFVLRNLSINWNFGVFGAIYSVVASGKKIFFNFNFETKGRMGGCVAR